MIRVENDIRSVSINSAFNLSVTVTVRRKRLFIAASRKYILSCQVLAFYRAQILQKTQRSEVWRVAVDRHIVTNDLNVLKSNQFVDAHRLNPVIIISVTAP